MNLFRFSPVHRSNPVIPLVPASWYASMVAYPTVMIDPFDSTKLRMYATGSPDNSSWSIGWFSADRSDPTTWTSHGVLLTPGSGWESGVDGLFTQTTIFDSGTIYLFYCATKLGGIASAIGVATSTDGTTFTKYSGNPVLTGSGQGRNDGFYVSQPGVIKEGSNWTMSYSYCNGGVLPGYRCATSSDGFTWTKQGSGDIVTMSPLYAEGSNIIKIDSTYHLIFSSGNNSNSWNIYIADSSVATGPYSNKRIIFRGAGTVGAWDRYHVSTPFYFNDSLPLMFYQGAGDHDQPFSTNTWPLGVTQLIDREVSSYR